MTDSERDYLLRHMGLVLLAILKTQMFLGAASNAWTEETNKVIQDTYDLLNKQLTRLEE